MASSSSSDIGAFRSLISASYLKAWICSGVIDEKSGVRPTGVAMLAMPGVPKGVAPGVPPIMPMPPMSGVAPGVAPGVAEEPTWDLSVGVASVGVASTPGVAETSPSFGVSSHRARLRLPPPATGVSPHWPGVGVSPISSSESLSPASAQAPLFPFLSSSSSRGIGVSMPPSPPTGVAHLSPSGSAFFLSASLPTLESHLRFFVSVGALPSAFCNASSSFCFWIFRKTSCFSLSSCWPTITSLYVCSSGAGVESANGSARSGDSIRWCRLARYASSRSAIFLP
mmetsp:Transcript_28314/g.85362  ORF Transcript_28314/g.85362 Transcript_28314/m.85362 type:complete len:283 (-) Transcript_28314:279-1127(-)